MLVHRNVHFYVRGLHPTDSDIFVTIEFSRSLWYLILHRKHALEMIPQQKVKILLNEPKGWSQNSLHTNESILDFPVLPVRKIKNWKACQP